MARRLYTSPGNIPAPWPYIVTTPLDGHLKWYLERYGHAVRALLYDSGVSLLGGAPAYPPGYLRRYIEGLGRAARLLERHAPQAELYYVVPDVPGDRAPYPLNVARTLEYARLFLRLRDRLPGTPIAVVQGARGDPGSLLRAYIGHRDLYDEYDVIALGRVDRRPRLIARAVAMFDQVAARPFHAFGLPRRSLRYLAEWGLPRCMLSSADTPAYVFDLLYRNGAPKTREAMAWILLEAARRAQELLDSIPCRPGMTRWLH